MNQIDSTIKYKLDESDFDLFTFELTTNGILITLKTTPLDEDIISSKTNLHFIIQAFNEDQEDIILDRAVVVIDLPRDVCRHTTVFEKPLYEGEVTSTLDDITYDVIQLIPASNRDGVTFELDTNCEYCIELDDIFSRRHYFSFLF